MRTGACAAVQQTLTTEAASVLKHSLSLARRRGHAQITPLHVAATLLSSRFSLLKRACLKSQPSSCSSSSSHPLQCRALELCFNVALNRLPASPAPLLHGQPSLSNALVAALKRAQAHQRRGCIEQQQQQQQQPHWVIKVEVEQLVLSILDDPSVSRVMREAGFSSTAVKATLEELSSSVSSVFQAYNSSGGGIYSTPSSPPTQIYKFPEEDLNVVNAVVHVLLGGPRRNVVIVADSPAATHGVFNDLMGKVERGQVPEDLKSAHFIKFQFSTAPLALMRREEVETNMAELKRKVESLAGGRGVIIYTGDLKWTVDNAAASTCAYNPVDHLVAEIGRLLSSCTKVWLVGTANFQTYIKCQMRQPPLDLLWALQPVSVPSGSSGLSLSLNATSSFQDLKMAIPQNQSNKKEEEVVLTCCPECTSNYAREAGLNQKSFETKGGSDKPLAQLPDWLIPHAPHQKDEWGELRRKWNRICESLHHQTRNSVICKQGKNLLYTTTTGSIYPSPGWANDENGTSFLCDSPVVKSNLGASCVPRFRRQQSCHIEFSFSNSKNNNNNNNQPNLDSLRSEGEDNKEVKISLALGNSPIPIPEKDLVISNELHENLPWQSQDSLSAIRETLMGIQNSGKKQEWLLIQGNDMAGKRRLARLIAHSILPSSHLLCLNMRRIRKGSSPNSPNHTESLEMGIRNHPRIVVLVESVDLADPHLLKFLANTLHNGISSPCHAVFVLTINDDDQSNRDNDEDYTIPIPIPITMKLLINETPNKDLKRRAEWGDMDLQISKRKSQIRRTNTNNLALDLNIKAEDDDEEEEEDKAAGESSPISSDLTRDSSPNDPLGFLETIKNQVVLNKDSTQEQKAKDMFSSKIKQSLEQVLGGDKNTGVVDENLTEELLQGCGDFLNSLFEKWLKDVVQTSLQNMLDDHRKEGVSNVRLCLGEKGGDTFFQDGFMGTCLPKRI
nr:protein SMAX1-LIKE 4-like [Ipomoea batatas]